jgi:c-di-GMP-binding flagellar brake protein YcgR
VGEENRKYPRVDMKKMAIFNILEVKGIDFKEIASVQSQMENLSSGGLCLICGKEVSPGTLVEMFFRTNTELFKTVSTVMWCSKMPEGRYKVGVRFDVIFEKEREVVTNFLKEVLLTKKS